MNDQQPPSDNKAKSAQKPGERKISAKRQAILAGAFAQLRKSRAKIEPTILQKIRDIVSGSPELMKTLGVTDTPKKEPKMTADEDMPLSSKAAPKTAIDEKVAEHKPKEKGGYEAVDQGKNMEVMAKLMELSPDNRDNIKAVIKKNQK